MSSPQITLDASSANEIELERYCDSERETLKVPFSRGEHSYATDGRFCIRVPRRATVSDGGPDAAKLFPSPLPQVTPARFGNLPKLPKKRTEECDECDGSGHEHECPDCTCECYECGGKGTVEIEDTIHLSLRGDVFNARYVHMLAELPGIQLQLPAERGNPLYFRFNGGDGLLMPMNWDISDTKPAEL